MGASDNLRFTKLVLNNGLAIPALGFGTRIPDPTDTKNAVIAALEVGFRQFDCAERYGNETSAGDAIQQMFQSGKVSREEVFIGAKLWNNNHRPLGPPGTVISSSRVGSSWTGCRWIPSRTSRVLLPSDSKCPGKRHGYDWVVGVLR